MSTNEDGFGTAWYGSNPEPGLYQDCLPAWSDENLSSLCRLVQAPLFIAQGANDPRVNVDESDQMVKAMKEKGIEVEYLVKDNEGHGFRNEENKFDFYRAMEKFLSIQLLK